MITDAFDKSEALFGSKDFYGKQKHLCDKFAGYLSHIGSALAGSDVIDVNWITGANYREEGLSSSDHSLLIVFNISCNNVIHICFNRYS